MKSHDGVLQFGDFTLDPANRRLLRDGAVVELGGRYLDALVLLASEPGQLITKDRLHDEVWRGVPVTDEALSQAIMAVRRALGDDAARPRYIETVPRHGYRFVAAPRGADVPPPCLGAATHVPRTDYAALRMIAGGVLGAAAAGALVGLTYGSLAAGEGAGHGLSLVMVLTCVAIIAALVSGLGIATGIALAARAQRRGFLHFVAGGALGGTIVGGFARLLGIDTMNLLFGAAPDRIAGALEGMTMGAAAGMGYWLCQRDSPIGRMAPGLLGGMTGAAIVTMGGTLMAGSLAALVARFPDAALGLEWAADKRWLKLSAAFEGALFTGLLVHGLAAARR